MTNNLKEHLLTDAEVELADDVAHEMEEMFKDILEASEGMEDALPIMLNTAFYWVVRVMADAGLPESSVHELVNDIYTTFYKENSKQ